MQESSTRTNPTSYSHSKPDDKPLSCYICKEEHFTFKCSKLIAAKDSEKKKLVENSKLCMNCLIPGHPWNSCKSIKTSFHGNKKLHFLLHSIYGKTKKDKSSSTQLNTETKLNLYGLKPTAVVA
ncbi:unnamed protein product [Allacma fusca]|uniref:Uncharacterized protein n=1 Tax=Allacma fusca TaxID=39272 RepID=A0A8J2KV62_9HEXA|nr:unnamed protein product [Allacma fusca]